MSALLTPHQLERYKRPSKYAGLTQFDYTPKGTELELECWLDYSPSEAQTWNDPGSPANATLHLAEVNGEDIAEILSESTIDEIEEAFLNQGE